MWPDSNESSPWASAYAIWTLDQARRRGRGVSPASITRGRDYLLAPHATYEQVGDVPNVVFPCAALVDREADRVSIYYGGADTVVCLAHAHLSELLAFVRS